MSNELSFLGRAGRRVDASARSHVRSAIRGELHVGLNGDFDRPVSLVRLLQNAGLTLTDAHRVVTDLTDLGSASAVVFPENPNILQAEIGALNLMCSFVDMTAHV